MDVLLYLDDIDERTNILSITKKIRIGIVGLGFGAEFIPIYQNHPHAEPTAICQRDSVKLDAIGDAFGIAKRYTNWREMLQDPDLDAIHINSPIPDHAAMSWSASSSVAT